MSDEAALLRAVRANPTESTPKLVLADYHDDNGRPLHAAVWRAFGGYDADNPRVRAYAASKQAYAHADPLSKSHDPEHAARDHLLRAIDHTDEAEGIRNYADEYDVPAGRRAHDKHVAAAKAHTEAAHALSPGLRAHAATESILDQDREDVTTRRAHSFSANAVAHGPRPHNGTKSKYHARAADTLASLAANNSTPHNLRGGYEQAARLHREAADYYAHEAG